MQGMKGLTKEALIQLINENFDDNKHKTIATLFYCGDVDEKQQQCILFHKEIPNY